MVSLSLSELFFFAFPVFLLFPTESLEVSRFLSAFSETGQMMGSPGVRWEAFAIVAVSGSEQSTFTLVLFHPHNNAMSWISRFPFQSRGA